MKKVFFTGHRSWSQNPDEVMKLIRWIYKLISEGTVDFYAGGAKGWDMSFENLLLFFRDEKYPSVKLHLVLPCPPEEQIAKWNKKEKEAYMKILKSADSVEIVSEHYGKNCMKKRNQRLVELGDVCLCYYDERRTRSGTGQTVRLAQKSGKEIINFYKEYLDELYQFYSDKQKSL